jgi:hypothetical protein
LNKASSLIGKKVKNSQGQTLGKVKDLVVDFQSGRVSYVVIDAKPVLEGNNTFVAAPLRDLRKSSNQDALVLSGDRFMTYEMHAFSEEDWPSPESFIAQSSSSGDASRSLQYPRSARPSSQGEQPAYGTYPEYSRNSSSSFSEGNHYTNHDRGDYSSESNDDFSQDRTSRSYSQYGGRADYGIRSQDSYYPQEYDSSGSSEFGRDAQGSSFSSDYNQYDRGSRSGRSINDYDRSFSNSSGDYRRNDERQQDRGYYAPEDRRNDYDRSRWQDRQAARTYGHYGSTDQNDRGAAREDYNGRREEMNNRGYDDYFESGGNHRSSYPSSSRYDRDTQSSRSFGSDSYGGSPSSRSGSGYYSEQGHTGASGNYGTNQYGSENYRHGRTTAEDSGRFSSGVYGASSHGEPSGYNGDLSNDESSSSGSFPQYGSASKDSSLESSPGEKQSSATSSSSDEDQKSAAGSGASASDSTSTEKSSSDQSQDASPEM